MYIKFDDNNNPEYAFDVEGNEIKKFFPLTDKKISYIVLPEINKATELSVYNASGLRGDQLGQERDQLINFLSYLHGDIRICRECFKGVKDATIVVPFSNSVKLDKDTFDRDASIRFALPENTTIREILSEPIAVFEACDEYEKWALICDKRINGTCKHTDRYKISPLSLDKNDPTLRTTDLKRVDIDRVLSTPDASKDIEKEIDKDFVDSFEKK